MEAGEATRLTRCYYDKIGTRYFELFHDELEGKPYDRALFDRFAQGLARDARILDAGCGPCVHVARYLRERGFYNTTGVDLSPECLKLARQHDSDVPLVAMDLAQLALADASVDALIAYYAILYTPKQYLPELFRELHRVLKPGGRILIAVKEGNGEGFIHDPLGTEYKPWFVWYQQDELTGFMKQAGFETIRAETRAPYTDEIGVRRIYAIGRKQA